MSDEQGTAPGCTGKPNAFDHPLIDLGECEHRVNGAVHGYSVRACPACGVTQHLGPMSFACGRGIKAVAPTPKNCLGLKFKAEREVRS